MHDPRVEQMLRNGRIEGVPGAPTAEQIAMMQQQQQEQQRRMEEEQAYQRSLHVNQKLHNKAAVAVDYLFRGGDDSPADTRQLCHRVVQEYLESS